MSTGVIEGTLISRKFINLLVRHALPAKAQLVISDSLSGDILYPFDISNYYGNVEMGYTDINGELYFSNQNVLKGPIEYNNWYPLSSGNDIFEQSFEATISQDLLDLVKDNTSSHTLVAKEFDHEKAGAGWKLELIQIDVNSTHSVPGRPHIHDLTPEYPANWVWEYFEFDKLTGKVKFEIADHGLSLPLDTTYYDFPAGDPSNFLRFTWNFSLVDKVRNLPKQRAKYNTMMNHLPRI